MSRNEELEKFFLSAQKSTSAILGYHRIPPEAAEDIVQELFLRLVRDWEEINDPHRWLNKSLKYRCVDFWRNYRKHLFLDIEECTAMLFEPNETQNADAVGLKADIRSLLKNLRKKCRKLLQMRFGLGLSTQEISPIIGCRVSSIPRLTQRCKTSFSQVLAKTSYQRTA